MKGGLRTGSEVRSRTKKSLGDMHKALKGVKTYKCPKYKKSHMY